MPSKIRRNGHCLSSFSLRMDVRAGLSQRNRLGKGILGPGPISHGDSGTLGKSPSDLTWPLPKSNSAEHHPAHQCMEILGLINSCE